jgi:hypothetical protein
VVLNLNPRKGNLPSKAVILPMDSKELEAMKIDPPGKGTVVFQLVPIH